MHSNELSVGLVASQPFHGSPGSILRVREISRSLSDFGIKVRFFSQYPPEESWGSNVTSRRLPSIGSSIGIDGAMYNIARKALNNRFLVKPILSPLVVNRIVNSLAKNLIQNVKNGEIDLIQGEQDIAALACIRAKKKLGLQVVSSLHNIWSEELVAMGLITRGSKQYRFLQELEREIITESDLVIVVSQEMKQYLKAKYTHSAKPIIVIPPGGRAKLQHTPNRVTPAKVVYSGLVVKRGNLELFVNSMPFVLKKFPDTQFYITEKGEELPKIRKLARKIGVKPIFYWFENSADFYDFLASCHVGIVTSSNDLPRRIGPAVKLFDYLSVGLPIVSNDIGGWTIIIQKEQVGLLTNSDPASFAQGIISLLDNQELSLTLGKKGLHLIRTRYSWDKSAHLLLKEYRELLSDRAKVCTVLSSGNFSSEVPVIQHNGNPK